MRWYRANGRHDLPWRLTRDPYAVLVSEVMLQQTQVDRVKPYFVDWMERWPDAASLADAEPAEVIRAWAGLGYNRRALNLHRAAVKVTDRFEGRVPTDENTLKTLPGIGPYTAAAVHCFAGERRTPVLDTNTGRVIARARLGAADMRTAGDRRTREAASELLPSRGARDWNLALMDLGAMVCTARKPACDRCPLRNGCAWLLAGSPVAEGAGAAAVRFEETARFARGRIVDALRERDAMETLEIADLLPGAHAANVDTYLGGLERDGLIERLPGTERSWRLPGKATGR